METVIREVSPSKIASSEVIQFDVAAVSSYKGNSYSKLDSARLNRDKTLQEITPLKDMLSKDSH